MQIDRLTSVLLRRDPACHRYAHLPRRAFTKVEELFQVMLPMYYMEHSPLRRIQRAQNRMVEQTDPASETHLALRDDCIHRQNLFPNLVSHFFHRQAFRLHDRRRFQSGGYVAQS